MCFSHITGKNDLHQSGWSIYHPYSIFQEIMNLNLKIWNSTSGSTYGYIVLWSLLGKIQSSPIRMFYTSSSWEFQEGSEYPARKFKFSLWQQIWLHLYNVFQSHSHITGKFDLHQSGWSIGFATGTEKPAVFPKRVPRVRVRCGTSAYRSIPLPVPTVSRVFTGISQ